MKPITLHPGSLLLGAVFALGTFVAMAQKQVPGLGEFGDPQPYRASTEEGIAAHDWFEINQGTPYTVPAGKILVIRALGTSTEYVGGLLFLPYVRLVVDGGTALTTLHQSFHNLGYGGGTTMIEVPRMLTVPAGSVVEIVPDAPSETIDARAWCYLANE